MKTIRVVLCEPDRLTGPIVKEVDLPDELAKQVAETLSHLLSTFDKCQPWIEEI
jgi:hypothetical protein